MPCDSEAHSLRLLDLKVWGTLVASVAALVCRRPG